MNETIIFIAFLVGGAILSYLWRSFDRFSSIRTDITRNLTQPFVAASQGSHVKIVAGELFHNSWNSDAVIEAVEEALKRGTTIDIICGPEIDKSSEKFLEMAKANRSKIRFYQCDKRPEEHFKIVNDEEVWIEAYHPEFTSGSNRVIHSNSADIVQNAVEQFNRLMKSATQKQVEDLFRREIN